MVDITKLTSLITAFRQETEQGSISPETLGALLQAIANEFLNASSDQDQVKLAALYENLQTMGSCLVTVAQSSTDRNNVLANITKFNPTTGVSSTQTDTIFIKQATTERAGVMRAQHVDDLYTAKKNISTLEDNMELTMAAVSELDDRTIAQGEEISNLSNASTVLENRVSRLPLYRGTIVIDSTSITSPVSNYFYFNMPDGQYDLVRGNVLIGQVHSYLFNGYRIFDIIGLCHINSSSFVYHTRLDHILLRVSSDNQIVATGSLEHTNLQNQISALQSSALAEETVTFSNADTAGNSISGTCIRHGSVCNIFGYAYIDMEQSSIDSLLPFVADDSSQPLMNIYYEDTMQWVKVYIYNDDNGSHIAAQIPEDFMNGGEVAVHFSLTFKIKD